MRSLIIATQHIIREPKHIWEDKRKVRSYERNEIRDFHGDEDLRVSLGFMDSHAVYKREDEATRSSESLVSYHNTSIRRDNPEDLTLKIPG
jgi:hypothetical protein